MYAKVIPPQCLMDAAIISITTLGSNKTLIKDTLPVCFADPMDLRSGSFNVNPKRTATSKAITPVM